MGGVIGGIGQYAAAKKQAEATEKAAQLALTGYNYLTTGAGKAANQAYIDTGGNANNMMAALLGVPTGPAAGTGPTARNALTNANGKIMGMAGGASAQNAYNAANTPAATTAGNSTLSAAQNGFNNYLNSTAYQFQLGQGQNAIGTSAAARGLLNSGATAKALDQYGQNLAGTTFNNFLGQLGNLSAAGQNALTRTANAGGAGGGGAASAMIANGNAQAGGIIGLSNSIGNAVGGLFNGFNSGGNSNLFPPAPSSGSTLQAMGIL